MTTDFLHDFGTWLSSLTEDQRQAYYDGEYPAPPLPPHRDPDVLLVIIRRFLGHRWWYEFSTFDTRSSYACHHCNRIAGAIEKIEHAPKCPIGQALAMIQADE